MAGNKEFDHPNPAERLHDCRFLLGGLVALLMAIPFLEAVTRPVILASSLTGVFVAAVFVVDAGRRRKRLTLIIAAIQAALTVFSLNHREDDRFYAITVALALLAMTVLILFSTYCVLRYVLQARVITEDQIYAGISMYLMLGFAFGAVYALISILDPRSFASNVALLTPEDKPDLVYFSFVTLATLGYGDITPRTNIARSLAVLEALAGMLYIAIFMARLVSLRTEKAE